MKRRDFIKQGAAGSYLQIANINSGKDVVVQNGATTNGAPITDDFTGTRLEIHGTEGYVVLGGDRLRLASVRSGYALQEIQLPPAPPGAGEVVFGLGHVYEVMDFVTAVRQGARPPVPGGDGRHLMAVLTAAYASARGEREVGLEDRPAAYSDLSAGSGDLLIQGGGRGLGE